MSGSLDDLIEATLEALDPIEKYAQQCHAASLALVNSGVWGESRVARGTCHGVWGQHSWLVVGDDCFDKEATIVDVTAWSYMDGVDKVWVTTMEDSEHRPHGWGPRLINWGCPESGGGEEVELTPTVPLSAEAKVWLRMFKDRAGGPLDRRFWSGLVNHAPMRGWPAGEFIAAIDDTEEIRMLTPIDLLGMLTDRNPMGLYLRTEEAA